jgi:hypothetical protein
MPLKFVRKNFFDGVLVSGVWTNVVLKMLIGHF